MDKRGLGVCFAVLVGCLVGCLGGGLTAAKAGDAGFKLIHLSGHLVKWGPPVLGSGAEVSYAFIERHQEFAGINCRGMDPIFPGLAKSSIDALALRSQARAAFTLWSSAANINFVEAADPDIAGILIGAQSPPDGWAFTNVEDEEPGVADPAIAARLAMGSNDAGSPHATSHAEQFEAPRSIVQSRICFNTTRSWKVGFDGNLSVYDFQFTLAHEIGHAIGLDHPGPTGALMGYRYTEKVQGLMAGDIQGAATLYGPRPGQLHGAERVPARE